MADDLYELEVLSLVAKITQEVLNYTGIKDKTLAEFVISLHDESKSLSEFKTMLKDTGADFPDSFIENIDRLILSMHPKHKKKSSSNGQSNGKQTGGIIDEQEKNRRLFPGLALPDQEWRPSAEKDVFLKEVDDMMAQLEGARKKKAGVDPAEDERATKRQRRSRSRSPRRRNPSPPRGRREDRRDDRRNDKRGRVQIDDRPVLYKIYNGRVSSMKDFGAFVTLEGVAGRVEGELRCHSPFSVLSSYSRSQVLYIYRPFSKEGAPILHPTY